jgi:hydroxymethylglutaryl-CoA reductase (NADPH)
MNIREHKTVLQRRSVVEKELKIDLYNVGTFTLDESAASTRNCENMIGAAQIPMGIAGPVNGKYIPLATTEGALVASVNRGCRAITGSGGATALAVRVGATRGPVFKVKNMEENSRLYDFVLSHKAKFNELAKTTSGHISLINIETNSVGLYRFVRFTFDTQDAMGLNMVTIATQAIVSFIEQKTGIQCLSLAGNFDVDKKPSWLNFTHGRGFEVWAEVVIPDRILQRVLKTTAQKIYGVWLAKCMIGSAMSGSMGFNAQYANVVAALFIATGQDPAHVVEGSLGITTTEIMNGKDLYVSIYLPDLMVGMVGGGTGLATQQEALKIIGVTNSQGLAEIVGTAVLAGEISLLASLSEGTLAQAHQLLGRGGK